MAKGDAPSASETSDLLALLIEIIEDYPAGMGDLVPLSFSATVICGALRNIDPNCAAGDAWSELASALMEIEQGIQPDLLTAKRHKRPFMQFEEAIAKAIASAAISKSPRPQMRETCRKASRKLGMTADELWTYRKNLMKGKEGRIKSPDAHYTYDECMRGALIPAGTHGGVAPPHLSKLLDKPTVQDWLAAVPSKKRILPPSH